MILCFVLLGMKRVRLAKSDDLDSLFRISRWVTPANRNESRGKKPNLTRRRGDAEKAEGENSKGSTVSSPISPPRLRVNKTPGGAQSYGMKRVRLAKSDDLESLFRISRWVTPANRNESGGKKPNLTRRRGDAEKAEWKTGRTPPYRHQSPHRVSASPREQNSGWSPVLWEGRKWGRGSF